MTINCQIHRPIMETMETMETIDLVSFKLLRQNSKFVSSSKSNSTKKLYPHDKNIFPKSPCNNSMIGDLLVVRSVKDILIIDTLHGFFHQQSCIYIF